MKDTIVKGRDGRGCNKFGYFSGGYNANKFDIEGYNWAGFHYYTGFSKYTGFNPDGIDHLGNLHPGLGDETHYVGNYILINKYNYIGLDKNGFFPTGFDLFGLNEKGFNCHKFYLVDGVFRDKDGNDYSGRDVNGCGNWGGKEPQKKIGYDAWGFADEKYATFVCKPTDFYQNWQFDICGFDIHDCSFNGQHRSLFDSNGFAYCDGKNNYGYTRADVAEICNFNQHGFDRDGFDRNGFDRNGFDRNGFDRNGQIRDEILSIM